VLLKLNPLRFWKKCIPVQIMAFLTSSTISSLPFAMKLSQEKLGISEEKINLVMPYSTAINMNGGAMHFALATVFVAHLFNVNLVASQYVLIFFMSIICSIGTAPVPGFSIFLLGNMFNVVGVPVEGVLILFGINTITDMFRTFNNLTGDIFMTLLVDRKIGNFNKELYDKAL
jgi:Na+/H+-dicarboxylate symporter